MYGIGSFLILFIPCIGIIGGPLCAYYAIKKGKEAQQDPAQHTMGGVGYVLGILGACLVAVALFLGVLS